jgi:uncharacterized protein (UPF0333 family)
VFHPKIITYFQRYFSYTSRCSLFMKNIILILIILLPLGICAQKIIQVKSRKTDEVFEAYKTDKSFKDGTYTKYYKYTKRKNKKITGYYSNNKEDSVWNYFNWQGNLYKTGRFNNGQKNGDWKFYFSNTKTPRSIGKYQNGQKSGVWEYFNKNGILIHKFDHTSNNLVYYTSNEDAIEQQPNELENDLKNHNPMILGGNQGMNEHIKIEFEYPKEAALNGVSGTVYVFFTVDENIQMNDFFVEDNLGYGISEEAIRLVKTGPTWIPKKVNGRYVVSKGRLPINFRIQ